MQFDGAVERPKRNPPVKRYYYNIVCRVCQVKCLLIPFPSQFFSGSVNNGFTFLSLEDKKVKPIYYIYLLY